LAQFEDRGKVKLDDPVPFFKRERLGGIPPLETSNEEYQGRR
jgi:hypothetical protein